MDKSAVTTKYIANKVIRGIANRGGTLSNDKLKSLVHKLILWGEFKHDQLGRVLDADKGLSGVINDIPQPLRNLLPKKIQASLPRTTVPGLPSIVAPKHKLPWSLTRGPSITSTIFSRRALADASDAIRHLSSKPNNPDLLFPLSSKARQRITRKVIGEIRKDQLSTAKNNAGKVKPPPIRPQTFRGRLKKRLSRLFFGGSLVLPHQIMLARDPAFSPSFNVINPGRNIFTWTHELGHALDHARRGINTGSPNLPQSILQMSPESYLDEVMANRRGSQLLRHMQQTRPNSFYNNLPVKDYLNTARTVQQEGYKTHIMSNQLQAGLPFGFGINNFGIAKGVRVPGYMRKLYDTLEQARSVRSGR